MSGAPAANRRLPRLQSVPRLIAIGCSTGGPGALRALLTALPPDLPAPVVVAQHLSVGFEGGLGDWLSEASPFSVQIAHHGQPLAPGKVLLGKPGTDLVIHNASRVGLHRAEPRGFHPSVDLLFTSAARYFPGALVAVVLSGVGTDGAQGTAAVIAAGGVVMAQDRATSAAYGMPGAAERAGTVSFSGAPELLARAISQLCSGPPATGRRAR